MLLLELQRRFATRPDCSVGQGNLEKQLAVVEQLTAIIAAAAGDPTLADRTWVLLTEAPDGGWGLKGHADTNEELVLAARAQLADLSVGDPDQPDGA